MSRHFDERFNLQVGQEEARRRFTNRALNDIFDEYLGINALIATMHALQIRDIESEIASALGERHIHGAVLAQVAGSFLNCLRGIEGLYSWLAADRSAQKDVSRKVNELLAGAETDLGVTWTSGRFLRSGAKELDDALVNQPLRWLEDPRLAAIRQPFTKAVELFLQATTKPESLLDVITDLYESLEAAAKLVTGRQDKDLTANAELFIKHLAISPQFRDLLKQYMEYANSFRHAAAPARPREIPATKEVEAFLYITGVFLRLTQQWFEGQPTRAA